MRTTLARLCSRPFAPGLSRQRTLGGVAVATACGYALLALLFAGTLAAGPKAEKARAVFEPITMGLAEAVFSIAGWLVGPPA